MFDTGVRQLRMALSMVSGRRVDPAHRRAGDPRRAGHRGHHPLLSTPGLHAGVPLRHPRRRPPVGPRRADLRGGRPARLQPGAGQGRPADPPRTRPHPRRACRPVSVDGRRRHGDVPARLRREGCCYQAGPLHVGILFRRRSTRPGQILRRPQQVGAAPSHVRPAPAEPRGGRTGPIRTSRSVTPTCRQSTVRLGPVAHQPATETTAHGAIGRAVRAWIGGVPHRPTGSGPARCSHECLFT